MKNYILTLIFITFLTGANAQDVQYSYDANGARVLRQVIVMMQLPDDSTTVISSTNEADMLVADNETIISENELNSSDRQAVKEFEMNAKNLENFAETLEGTEITVYPNPTAGELKVAFSDLSNMNQGTIILYDNAGKQISTQKIRSTLEQLDVSKQAKGNYIMLININGVIKEWTIVKM